MIEESYIRKLIEQGEGEHIEFKSSTTLIREITHALCGFANKSGGEILVGVKEDGQIVGQQVSDDTLTYLSNTIKLNTDPKLFPAISKVEIEGKTIIYLRIGESPLKPHLAYGRSYIRTGASTMQISRDEYNLYLLKLQNGYGFDYQYREDASLSDINEAAIYSFVEIANEVRNVNINLTVKPMELLESLSLAKQGKLTNAAILLFGKRPADFFPGRFEVKCGVFPDNETYSFLLDNHEFDGNLIENFNSAISFLYRHINIAYKKSGWRGETSYEFTDEVLREALANMIVHKDYRRAIKNTIEIRPGWIRFYNPAHLFQPDITIEKLYQFHPSRPGNPLIAKAFFWLGHLESWGGGTLRIIEDLKRTGKKSPVFVFEDDMFELKLPRTQD
jgi:ATP-dependent DNA helicase RecG